MKQYWLIKKIAELFYKYHTINNILFHSMENNLFVKTLETTTVDNFIDSQKSFVYAVENWSKALITLLLKVPSYKERAVLIENLYDEHGSGNVENAHVITINKLVNNTSTKDHETYKFIEDFNIKLNEFIDKHTWLESVALLGSIEYEYQILSFHIHIFLKKHLEEDKIYHYNEHEVLDIKHAQDLLDILKNYTQAEYSTGLLYGKELINDLYTQLAFFL